LEKITAHHGAASVISAATTPATTDVNTNPATNTKKNANHALGCSSVS
jgi:hypothetical protein